ncbi:MAG: glycosyltransferase family 4 protein, partial [Candidatus Hydrogenedentes bacterium]|nr:glycosyltransferase family 4 protein [Candidatus Hydrogenedentota bacterium]
LISHTNLIFEYSKLSQKKDIENFNLSEEKCPLVPLAIDLDRFSPERDLPDIRSQLKLSPNAILIGIVARIQAHRKYEMLLHTVYTLLQEGWKIYLVIIGRGTKQEELVIKPINQLGIRENVIFAGYLDKDDYVAMLKAIDIGVYLVPGTDGTCRTVREFMAMGKPVIATKAGILPELVDNMKTGILIDDNIESLYTAIRELCAHPQLKAELGNNARAKAFSQFSPSYQAQVISEFYTRILENF